MRPISKSVAELARKMDSKWVTAAASVVVAVASGLAKNLYAQVNTRH